ncbi:hypothetical protein LPJ61_002662 [Coemansia biformis]|uniref:DUF7719 domain-containing protein n=1 Tax=Coemansia biformis TaxID=1286918 RepID=A0A9W7Y7X8_9FUNG|nr:hypothetical protein LPJ61_002662 [Coemansia biformis]
MVTISEDEGDNVPLINSVGGQPAPSDAGDGDLPKLEHPSASRIVGAGPRLGPDGKPHYLIDDIPDNEKLRLIRESGIMRKYAKSKTHDTGSDIDEDAAAGEEGDEPLAPQDEHDPASDIPAWMDAIIYTVGLAAIYGLFEALVNQQYSVDVTVAEIVQRMARIAPALYAIVYFTFRFRRVRAVSLLMLLAATACGCYFIHLNLHSPRLGIMRRAPGLVTLWIYLTFLMDVRPAIVGSAVVGLFWIVDPFKQTL